MSRNRLIKRISLRSIYGLKTGIKELKRAYLRKAQKKFFRERAREMAKV